MGMAQAMRQRSAGCTPLCNASVAAPERAEESFFRCQGAYLSEGVVQVTHVTSVAHALRTTGYRLCPADKMRDKTWPVRKRSRARRKAP